MKPLYKRTLDTPQDAFSADTVPNTITLLDGRQLPLYLKSEQPDTITAHQMSLDTTGQYLSLSTKFKNLNESDAAQARRQYNHHIFTENAWFLLSRAEEIFSDSRMFLVPVKIQNGLAYTGTGGFRQPTIGVYLEWWLNHKEAAVDEKGNLVWYISGSPLSGANCCSSVTPEGVQTKISQRTSFSAIWTSFISVNNRYTEAKQRAEAYTLEQVLLKLRGEEYKSRIVELKHEMEMKVMKWNLDKLVHTCKDLNNTISRLFNTNRKLQLESNKAAILQFAAAYLEKEAKFNALYETYVLKHKDLKWQLHAGTLNGDYKVLLNEASKESRELKFQLSQMANNFMQRTFGKNPNQITLKHILTYAQPRLDK